jgi:heterodisulfide reductase subunit B
MDNLEKAAQMIKAILVNDIALRVYLSRVIQETEQNIDHLKTLSMSDLDSTLQQINQYFTTDMKTSYNNLSILINSSKNISQKEEIIQTMVQLINSCQQIFNHLNTSKETNYRSWYTNEYNKINATCKNISDMRKRELNIDQF